MEAAINHSPERLSAEFTEPNALVTKLNNSEDGMTIGCRTSGGVPHGA
jgi:hypothetical protein